MSDVLLINGRFTRTDEPVLTVEERGFQFGDSLYEVIKFLGRAPRFAKAHWERLREGLAFLEIASPWASWGAFAADLDAVVERTEFDEGILYLQVTRGAAERSHVPRGELDPTVIIYSRAMAFPDQTRKRDGVATVTHDDARWQFCRIKSVNLLPNVMAKRTAVRAGTSEAILIREGVVTEGSQSNLFLVEANRLITHPANDRILPGIVRAQVLAIARQAGIDVEERPVDRAELLRAGELFLTSTTQGVMPIVALDGERVGGGTRGPVTARLQSSFDALERSVAAIDAS